MSDCKRVSDIDWESWVPIDIGTLCFILRGGEILLIRKKRGLGAGKIVGPGGRLEPGESVLECAVRETIEEVGVVPEDPRLRGELRFAASSASSSSREATNSASPMLDGM